MPRCILAALCLLLLVACSGASTDDDDAGTESPPPAGNTTPTPGYRTPTPEATAEATPTSPPASMTTPTPEPVPEATPTPEPGPEATPTPEPGPEATPTPKPGPEATPTPKPGPEVTPTPIPLVDADGDGVPAGEDCDDTDPAVHPGAQEVCDAADVDEDCNGLADDQDPGTSEKGKTRYYLDRDGDGYGDEDDAGAFYCDDPSNAGLAWVTEHTDCDDLNADVNPGAVEVCNDGIDDDCDGKADEDLLTQYFRDEDVDGYGVTGDSVMICKPVYPYLATEGGDCDDAEAGVHPGAQEVCDPEDKDEDCNGVADDDDPGVDSTSLLEYHPDRDQDGYGDEESSQLACNPPGADWTLDGTDCQDTDPDINPGAVEVCDPDHKDENCNLVSDDDDYWTDPSSKTMYYPDQDQDGYGDENAEGDAYCEDPSTGAFVWVSNRADCDDTDPLVQPEASEVSGDGVDNNCDGSMLLIGELDLREPDVILHGSSPAGASVAIAGDLDHDGYDDLVVGDIGEDTMPGWAYVWYGPVEDNYPFLICDVKLEGENEAGAFGCVVARGGDANADGRDDFLVSDCADDEGGENAGAAYLVSGALNPVIDVTDAAYKMAGVDENDLAGCSIASAGDVNADHADDVIVGAMGVEPGGAAYYFAGPIFSVKPLSTAYAVMTGDNPGDEVGCSVGGAVDLNADGMDDLLIGARGYSDSRGAVYIFYGPVFGNNSVSEADAVFVGKQVGGEVGYSVAGVGDVNGDGYDDVLVGAPHVDGVESNAGAAFLVLGPVSGTISTEKADATFLGEHESDHAGVTVAGAGDVNGDGFADLLIGASWEGSGATKGGAVYLILGPVEGVMSLADADTKFVGYRVDGMAGMAIAGGGDLNGDGYDDVVIAAPMGSLAEVYVILGTDNAYLGIGN